MKRFAIISEIDGTVVNVVVGDDYESVVTVVGNCIQENELTGIAKIGSKWNGSNFVEVEEATE